MRQELFTESEMEALEARVNEVLKSQSASDGTLVQLRRLHGELLILSPGKHNNTLLLLLQYRLSQQSEPMHQRVLNIPASTRMVLSRDETTLLLYSEESVSVCKIPDWREARGAELAVKTLRNLPAPVIKADFHPMNDDYVGVLTAAGKFALYDTGAKTVDVPEFETKVTVGGRRPASFCFGSGQFPSWEGLAVHFLLPSGEIHSLCPVVPLWLSGAVGLCFFVTMQEIALSKPRVGAKDQSETRTRFAAALDEAGKSFVPERAGFRCERLSEDFRSVLQGPVRVVGKTENEEEDLHIELATFDYFPFAYVSLTAGGRVSMMFSLEDIEPIFADPARHKNRTGSSRTFVLHSSISLLPPPSPPAAPVLHSFSPANPFFLHITFGNRLFRIENEWYLLSHLA